MVAANLRLGVGGHPALCLHSSNKPGRCGHKLLLLFFFVISLIPIISTST